MEVLLPRNPVLDAGMMRDEGLLLQEWHAPQLLEAVPACGVDPLRGHDLTIVGGCGVGVDQQSPQHARLVAQERLAVPSRLRARKPTAAGIRRFQYRMPRR